MPDLRVVFGLGNPGERYEQTPHNLGFKVVDTLAAAGRRRFGRIRGLPALATGVRVDRAPVLLVKPLTFMNRCGPVLAAIRDMERVSPGHLLVVVDDLNLPAGRLRLRPGGTDGGHNGLRSLIDHLGTEAFPRLRLGIGDPGGRPREEYVLDPIPAAERAPIDRAVEAAAAAVVTWARLGTDRAMSLVNRRS